MAVATALKPNPCGSAVALHQMLSFLFVELIKKSSVVYPSVRLPRLLKQSGLSKAALARSCWFSIVQAINF